ncbi:unnamed protein product, partial [Adineta ricciae]
MARRKSVAAKVKTWRNAYRCRTGVQGLSFCWHVTLCIIEVVQRFSKFKQNCVIDNHYSSSNTLQDRRTMCTVHEKCMSSGSAASEKQEQQREGESENVIIVGETVRQLKCMLMDLNVHSTSRIEYNCSLESFRKVAKDGPDYSCTDCRLKFFRDQVLSCIEGKYLKMCKSEETMERIKSYLNANGRQNTGCI